MAKCSDFVEASKFRRCILDIGERLRSNDIEKLHFICAGLIPEGRLQTLKGRSLLWEIAEIRTDEGVIEALIRIDRIDLLAQLTGDHQAEKTKYSSLTTTNFDRLRIVLLYIAKNMTDTEGFRILKDIVKPKIDDKRRLERVENILELFELLIQNVILHPSRPGIVLEVFHIYATEPWFEKVRSEYVEPASAAAAAAVAAVAATAAATLKEITERLTLIGMNIDHQLFESTASLLEMVKNPPATKECSSVVIPDPTAEKYFMEKKYDAVSYQRLNQHLNAEHVQTNPPSTPDSDDTCANTNRQGQLNKSPEPDDKSDTTTDGQRSPKSDTDDKGDINTDERLSSKTDPATSGDDDPANSSDDDNSKSCDVSSSQGKRASDPDNSNGDAFTQDNCPSTLESDGKSDQQTEIKSSSETVSDPDNSSDDATNQESDDKNDSKTEEKNSSKTDPDAKTGDTKIQGNLPSTSDLDAKTADTKPQGNLPSTPDPDAKTGDAKTQGNLPSTPDPNAKTGDTPTQGNLPSTSASDDKNEPNAEGTLLSKTNPDYSSDDASAHEKLSSTTASTTKSPLKTQMIKDGDEISYVNVLTPSGYTDLSHASSAQKVGYKPEFDNARRNSDKHFNDTRLATLEEYPMTRKPRGCAVIINIENFSKVRDDPTSEALDNRHGSSKDAEGLRDVFQKLHFIVDRHDDATVDEIISITDEFASRDHSELDCFVFCILTHGSEGKLYDTNGRPFQFEMIFKKFHAEKCRTLSGKPKLFFLQACQGNQHRIGRNLHADIRTLEPGSANTLREGNTNFLEGNSPNEADFLVFFPSRLGLPAFRNDNQGSWFIQSLVENLSKYGERCPLLEICSMVISEVSRKYVEDSDGNHYTQTPKFDSSLSKTLFFRPLAAP